MLSIAHACNTDDIKIKDTEVCSKFLLWDTDIFVLGFLFNKIMQMFSAVF